MDGLLPVLKPYGWTSFDVIRKLQRIVKREKIGHAGNLDALATGLLLVGFGKATKQLSHWLMADKEYIFQLQFGISTETLDRAGHHTQFASVDPAVVNQASLKDLIQRSFTGEILQQPPQYCALKMQGRRYSDLARDHIEADPPERSVLIHSLEVVSFLWDNMHPSAVLRLHCSHGTYVRSLCRDLAKQLQTIGMAKEICRIRIGNITISHAVSMSDLLQPDDLSSHFYQESKA
ncbi:tRNA pseudouridine(55) synthase TruB [bacterium]|nr:tRNA pseudouridine(55) synthase TruB [bacterium]